MRQTIAFHALEGKSIDLFDLYAGMASKDLSHLEETFKHLKLPLFIAMMEP